MTLDYFFIPPQLRGLLLTRSFLFSTVYTDEERIAGVINVQRAAACFGEIRSLTQLVKMAIEARRSGQPWDALATVKEAS